MAPCLSPAPARFSHFLLLNDFPPSSRSLEQAKISPVIIRLCLLANTKSWKLMLVNFESSQWLHLGIKCTFFVVLDTSQSIKRKLSWGRYGGGVMGSWYKHWSLQSTKHKRKTANFQFVFVHNTTLVEVLELWVLRTISGLPKERFALGR